jgi:hypothetical protein
MIDRMSIIGDLGYTWNMLNFKNFA